MTAPVMLVTQPQMTCPRCMGRIIPLRRHAVHSEVTETSLATGGPEHRMSGPMSDDVRSDPARNAAGPTAGPARRPTGGNGWSASAERTAGERRL
ncbi:hypothetical protein GCM10009627_04890 [Curtobacterium herbarum]|uniref:Uncharacterized protein n=1 Tax=Curtobacterium herbarum TaxID=150122 RepID=A0ABN1ZC02_9MICO